MDRKIMLGAGALALALAAGAAVGTSGGVASATAIPVTLTGPVTCSIAGSYMFNPGLTNGGGTASTVTVKAKLTHCLGSGLTNGTVTVASGHLVATSTTTVDNSFGAVVGGEALPVLTGAITWKATGGHVTSTAVSLTGDAIVDNTTTGVISAFVTPVLSGGSYGGQSSSTSGITANKTGFALAIKAGKGAVKSIAFGTTTTATFTIGA
jgi:hypothetical protein